MLLNAVKITSVSSFLAWLGWNVWRNSKINSMLVLICYAKLLRPIVNNGIYAIWDVYATASALTCLLLDKYCFCVSFLFLAVCLLVYFCFFLPKRWNKDVYIYQPKNSPPSPALATARIAPKIYQGQSQTTHSEYSRFYPNRFTRWSYIRTREHRQSALQSESNIRLKPSFESNKKGKNLPSTVKAVIICVPLISARPWNDNNWLALTER